MFEAICATASPASDVRFSVRRSLFESHTGCDHGSYVPHRSDRLDHKLADTCRDRAWRLPHIALELRTARGSGLLSHADVASERLGTRYLRIGAGDPEHPVGAWPT